MGNISDKVAEEIGTHISCAVNLFFIENLAVFR
jgi:hypothetical protein